jgi:phosphohistidine phosphatase
MPSSAPSTVRHLWLLRHGKAASDAPWGGSDRERPLTARGRRDATALGTRLARELPVFGLEGVPRPELAICSAAVRTRQTANLVAKAMGGRLPLDSYRSLYDAEADVVLDYVREIDDGVKSALMIGHNPSMYQVAFALLDEGDGERSTADRAALESHGFPTCALGVLTLRVAGWADVVGGCGQLDGVFKPPY